MVPEKIGRRTLTSLWMAIAITVLAVPAFAQGRIIGKVTDDADKPVEGATVTATEVQGGQKWNTKTDRNGSYFFGTIPRTGQYVVTAEKAGLGVDEARVQVRVGIRDVPALNFRLSARARATAEAAAKGDAIRKLFEEGVAAEQAGNHQAALDAFTKASVQMPTCSDCFYNIAVSQERLGNMDAAEEAYKKAIEVKPAYPEAYNALAALYTKQKKMDLAGAAAAKAAEFSMAAAGGGDADSLYAAGVGLWNANKFPEAQQAFEGAIKANANYADAHFMLGKVFVNLGKLPEAAAEFETYLKLEPSGKNAGEAKTTFEALKPLLK
jgi:tetratricopeptide (TPR) repeat protein